MIDRKKVRRRRSIVAAISWVIHNAVWIYVFYAGIWTILYLVDEIFQKMGVA